MSNKNYNKISTESKSKKDTTELEVKNYEPVPVAEEEEISEPIIGFVSNCEKLNIRRKPSKDSEILVIVNEGTKVEINEEFSTDDFYSVTADCPNNITVIGYAMKDFIALK